MKKKGFTLVELLVVIAIIALLMGILMPALARVRQIAYRLYCGTNLSGIGKAMLIYANDYDDELPRAGVNNGIWSKPITFMGATHADAFPAGSATITSCFFLLVKYSEVTPKSFLCKSDPGVSMFKVSDAAPGYDLVDLWDFGDYGINHCSYSYHNPFNDSSTPPLGGYSLTAASDPGMAVAGDPNPWMDSAEAKDRVEAEVIPDPWGFFNPDGDREAIKAGNALPHQDDGQNVLFVDGHTSFEKASFCGVDDDNVYTVWNMGEPVDSSLRKGKGTLATSPLQVTLHKPDSFLVTDNGPAGTAR